VADDREFQERVRQLGKLVAQFEQSPESSAKVAGTELVQLLMEVHGRGLERALEIVFESGNGAQGVIDKLGQDPIVGSLLLLYSLHPDELNVRVEKAVERIRPRLRKLSCSIELESLEEGTVRLRLTTTGHSCGSSGKDLRAIVEQGIFEYAPDLTELVILGLEEPAPAGFVALESLLGHSLTGPASTAPTLETEKVA
jgi:Fe-S cluster biogenesis protein NfuA